MPVCKRSSLRLASVSALALFSCSGLTPIYPPRPPATPGEPVADPVPSRVVLHATVTGAALRQALETKMPTTGERTVPLMGRERKFSWRRDPTALRFDRGRIGLDVHLVATVELPVSRMEFPLDFRVLAEPVVTSTYVVRMQSIEVSVTSNDSRMKLANFAAGALDKIQKAVEKELGDFSYDLRPTLAKVYERVEKPLPLPLGEANGCADLRVLGVEAGPTVLADGIEKDLALVVAPSITLPCAASDEATEIPPLANVATLQGGPFTVTMPIAARYEELAKAMSLAFTDGKLFFSKEYPALYMETPEVYAAKDQLVLKLHVAGPVHKFGFDTTIDGDIFFVGHPTVEDNELRVPDLEPTIETKSLLLKLKAALQGDSIRDEARTALRLDLGERLKAVRDKLSTELEVGDGQGCLKADAGKIEVTGVHAHGSYLRLYVAMTGRAAVYMPCP
jgi:Domain of unknown function (DUF4403)